MATQLILRNVEGEVPEVSYGNDIYKGSTITPDDYDQNLVNLRHAVDYIFYKNEWKISTLYFSRDEVSYNGSLWVCLVDHTSTFPNAPPLDKYEVSTTWQLKIGAGDSASGGKTAILDMYQWKVEKPVNLPQGVSTYHWADGTFNLPSTPNFWTLVPDTIISGATLWVTRVVVFSSLSGLGDLAVDWTGNASEPRAIGKAATDGVNGFREAFLELYKWSITQPSVGEFPSGTSTYTWDDGTFTTNNIVLNGWSVVPSGVGQSGETLWACSVRQISNDYSSNTTVLTWNTATATPIGRAGTDGKVQAILKLYNSSVNPTKPTSAQYTFTGNTFGIISGGTSGWTQDQPASNTTGIYMTQCIASTPTPNNQLTLTAWTTPIIVAINGLDSYSVILGNDSQTFTANSSGAAFAATVTIPVIGYKGNNLTSVSLSAASSVPVGMTVTPTVATGTSAYYTVDVTTAMLASNGTIGTVVLPITIDGNTINKVFSWSLVNYGVDGETYYLSSTATSFVKSTPSTTISGTYLPANITISAKKNISGQIISSGVGWITTQIDAGAESARVANQTSAITPAATGVSYYTFRMYSAASGGILLDTMTIPVVFRGDTGTKTALPKLHIWSTLPPSGWPSGTSTYAWADGTYSPPVSNNGWTLTGGSSSPGQTLYCYSVPIIADAGTDTQTTITWTGINSYSIVGYAPPLSTVQGPAGKSAITITVYKQNSTPGVPSGGSYNFVTGVLTEPTTNWFRTQPAISTTPTYASTRTFTGLSTDTNATDGSWSAVYKDSERSADGEYRDVIKIYNTLNISAPASGATYNFSTNSFTGIGTWTTSQPETSVAGTYMTQLFVSTTTPLVPVVLGTWPAPVLIAILGTSALSGYLTNESHTVPTESDGSGGDYSAAIGTFKVFLGTTDVTLGCTFDVTLNSDVIGEVINGSGIYGISGITSNAVNSVSVTFTATHVESNSTVSKVFSVTKAKTGVTGSSAKALRLSSTGQAITFDATGTILIPTNQTIIFTATQQNYSDTISFQSQLYDSANALIGNATLGGSGNIRTLSGINFGTSAAYCVVSISTSGTAVLSDSITIVKVKGGPPAISVSLSKDTFIFPATSDGAVTSYAGADTLIYAMEGDTQLVHDGVGTSAGKFKVVVTTATNIIAGAISGTSYAISSQPTSGVSDAIDTASILFTITGRSLGNTPFALTKMQTFTKAKFGGTGTAGTSTYEITLYRKTLTSTAPSGMNATQNTTYNFTTKTLTVTGGNWVPSIPVTGGSYLWIIKGVASSSTGFATLTNGEFSSPVLLVRDGQDTVPSVAPLTPVFTASNITMTCPLNADGIPIPIATLSWDSVANADAYQIGYKSGADYSYITVANTATTTKTVISFLLPSTTYTFTMRAFNGIASSSFCVPFTKDTVKDLIKPATPSAAPTLAQGVKTVVAKWNSVADKDLRKYVLEYDTVDTFATAKSIEANATTAGFSITPGTTYFARVKAVDASDNSSNWSTTGTIITELVDATSILGNDTITADLISVTTLSSLVADLGTITAGTINMTANGSHIKSGGMTAFNDGIGFWLGNDGVGTRFFLGSSLPDSQYLKWDMNSGLTIKGNITLVNTIPSTAVSGLGSFALISSLDYGSIGGTKPPFNADVTLAAINGGLIVTGGGITLSGAGSIKGGQTGYNVGKGFFLGYDGSDYKFSVGSSGNYLSWGGSALTVQGDYQTSPVNTGERFHIDSSTNRAKFYNASNVPTLTLGSTSIAGTPLVGTGDLGGNTSVYINAPNDYMGIYCAVSFDHIDTQPRAISASGYTAMYALGHKFGVYATVNNPGGIGLSDNEGIALYGQSMPLAAMNNSWGVKGEGTGGGNGVWGQAVAGKAVYGESISGIGTLGISTSSYGIFGQSATSYSGWFNGGLGVRVGGNLLVTGNITGTIPAYSNVTNQRQHIAHGFTDRSSSIMPVSSYAGTVFTLNPNPFYYIYVGGIRVLIGEVRTCDLATQPVWTGTTDDHGQWFVSFNASGGLAATREAWDIMDLTIIPVSVVLWDGTNSFPSEERHGQERNLPDHAYKHLAFGTQYIAGFTPTPTFGAGNANTFLFASGILADEDIFNNTSVLAGYIDDHTSCRIGYRVSGGESFKFDAEDIKYAKLSGAEPVYDNNGSLLPLGVGKYGIFWMYATNHWGCPIVSIVGQDQYNTVSAAQAAPYPSFPGFSVAEWKCVYRVIVRNVGNALSFVQADPVYRESVGPALSPSASSTVVASNVIFSPVGSIAASNVQGAIAELDTDKAAVGQTFFLGTTSVAINRASANLALTGISIDGTSTGISNTTWARVTTSYGYIDFGPANASWAHIYTDRPSFYFNAGISVNGNAVVLTNDTRLSDARACVVNYNNDSNSTYQMLWGSGNNAYGTAGIYCNPSTDTIYSYSLRGSGNVGGTGEAINCPAGIYVSGGTAWIYASIQTNNNLISTGTGSISGGAISGTTGTFSGVISGASITVGVGGISGGAISGTTGTFTGAVTGSNLSGTHTGTSSGTNTGDNAGVTSVGMSVPTGLTVSGSPVTSTGTLAVTFTAGYSIPTTTKQSEWDTAYTNRLRWDGGSTSLVAATGRTSLGATTVGGNLFTLVNPTAITFIRINANNTVSTLDAATFRTAIGAGTSSTTGTVTSVAAGAGMNFTTIATTGSVIMGTPSSCSLTTANSATGTTHTHTLSNVANSQGRVVNDCNHADFRVAGMYGFNNVPTNGPGTSYSAMIVATNSDVGIQIVGGYTNDNVYFRGWSGSGTTYYTWRKVLHDGIFLPGTCTASSTNTYSTTHTHAITGFRADTWTPTLANVTGAGNAATNSIYLPAVEGNAYRFWANDNNYSISMGVTAGTYQYGPVTDYSLKLTMGSGAGRGITFGSNGNKPVAAINTTSGNMQIAGTFSALSKSFLINHPTKPNMKLRHGSLEGPENGVYIRGRLTNSNTIVLPDYWSKLVDPKSITVTLTAIGGHQDLYVGSIWDGVITVLHSSETIDCFYMVNAERIDIDKLEVEE